MQQAEDLKRKGNALFLENDLDAALKAYQQAVIAIKETDISENLSDVREFLSVVYSNMSNISLSMGCYDDCWKAAQESIRRNPTFVKPWFRYVQARRLAGYPFEAFVAMLRYLRPLLRKQQSPQLVSGSDVTKQLEEPLYLDLGLLRVSPHIELEDYAGGVGIVTRKSMKPDDIIFVEKRFETSFTEMQLGVQHDLTTLKIVEYFAQKILPDQQAHSERWVRFNKEFKGCWPRTMEDILPETRRKIADALRPNLPKMSDESFDELLDFAVSCRYNCFHSGFFRACALANHSCRANAALKYNSADDTTTLICVRPIESGEFINVKYISDAHFVMGVGKRREHLRSWLFWCVCERCCADNEPSAVEEQMRCPHCHMFTHHPLPGKFKETEDADPILPVERPCAHCGEAVVWLEEWRLILSDVIASLSDVTTRRTYSQLVSWLDEKLNKIAPFQFHPEHWMYRVLFYYFCVPLTGMINEKFDTLAKRGWQPGHVEELLQVTGIRPLYADIVKTCNGSHNDSGGNPSTVVATEDVESGGDALYFLSVLWRLILTFYPESEGWALHLAICQLVLFAIIQPDEATAMPLTDALSLLRRHGKYIGKRDASLWMLAYNRHKPNDPHRVYLKQKQLKNIFQI